MPSKAYESPLIPHARMRALYRALVEVRALSRRLGKPRGGIAAKSEAPWAACALELREGDLLSCPGGHTALAEHVRAVGVRPPSRSARGAACARTLAGKPIRFSGAEGERLLCAAGAAMALQAAGEGNLVLAFVAPDALQRSAWITLLRVAAEASLPLILVVLPPAGSSTPASRAVALDRLAARASQPAIPVIPVDGADPIALYRVASESLGRARAGDGPAVVQAVPSRTDPVALLASQMLARGMATQRWLETVSQETAQAVHPLPGPRSKAVQQEIGIG